MTPLTIFAVLVLAVAAPASAELKFTTRMQLRDSATPAAPTDDAMLALFGSRLADAMLPGGSLEMTTVIGDRGIRVEWNKALPGIPAGAVMLSRPDGAVVMLMPADKTFWKLSAADVRAMMQGDAPTVMTKKTGEFSEIQGVRCERVTFDMTVPIPVPAGAQTPPGVPAELTMTGESCVAEQYHKYGLLMAKVPGLSALGGETLSQAGLPMRQVTRGAMFGAKEIESLITAIAEAPAPASLFEVPAGFKEVPAPGIGK